MIEFERKVVRASNIYGNFPVSTSVAFAKKNNNVINPSATRNYWRDLVGGGTPQY